MLLTKLSASQAYQGIVGGFNYIQPENQRWNRYHGCL